MVSVKNIFSKQNFISINMKDYINSNTLSKIIGSPPGYVGYEDKCLFDSINDYPFSIILIDNMDNPKTYVAKYLLGAFDEGYIENAKGEKINLCKCIIFITTRNKGNEIGFVEVKNKKNVNTYVLSDYRKQTSKI